MPTVISEDLSRTIAPFLMAAALREPVDPTLTAGLRFNESLNERCNLRTFLELVALGLRWNTDPEPRRRRHAPTIRTFQKTLRKAEDVPEMLFKLFVLLLNSQYRTEHVYTLSFREKTEYLNALNTIIEQLRTGIGLTQSPTLNGAMKRAAHIVRFEAVERWMRDFDPSDGEDHRHELDAFIQNDVTQDISFAPPDGLQRLTWMSTVHLCAERSKALRNWAKRAEGDGIGFHPLEDFSEYQRSNELWEAVRIRRYMMRTLRCVLPRFSTRSNYSTSFDRTTDVFIGQLLEICAAARFEAASQALAVANILNPAKGSRRPEALVAAMECILAEAVITATHPPKAGAVPVEELPPNLRTPEFERFREALLAAPESRQAAFETLASTEPSAELRTTYAHLAELQDALRSALDKPVSALAHQALRLAEKMEPAQGSRLSFFGRILILAEGASIVGEFDRLGIPLARDLLVLLEAFIDRMEHRLESAPFLKHRAFQFVRMALEDAFDFDGVLSVDVSPEEVMMDRDDALQRLEENGTAPEDAFDRVDPVVPEAYAELPVEILSWHGMGHLAVFGCRRSEPGEPVRLFALRSDHRGIPARELTSSRDIVTVKELAAVYPEVRDLVQTPDFFEGIYVFDFKREQRRFLPLDLADDAQSAHERLWLLHERLGAVTLWCLLGEEGFGKFVAQGDDEAVLKLQSEIDASRVEVVDRAVNKRRPSVP